MTPSLSLKEWQELLFRRGFDPGKQDGLWGPNTNRASNSLLDAYDLSLHQLEGLARAGDLRPLPISDPEESAPIGQPAFPSSWFPKGVVKRIVLHWTGGAYYPNPVDLAAYHFCVSEYGEITPGKFKVTDNTPPLQSGRYAPHAGGFNSYAAGLGLCGMHGAKESPLDFGKYPINQAQWRSAAELAAAICREYSISITRDTVVTHAEVLPRWGVGIYKWDITVLPWNTAVKGHQAVGDEWRRMVAYNLD